MALAEWQIWLILALAFVFADIALAGGASGVLLVLALGALGAMTAALLGLALPGQIVAAVVCAAVATPLVVWLLRRVAWQSGSTARTDLRVAGHEFEVVHQGERIGIRIQSEFFPARDARGADPIAGDRVRVVRFEGITAIVESVGVA